MAKAKENIKDLKNISSFGYGKLAMWGMVGALTLFIYAIVATILDAIIGGTTVPLILHIIGVVAGALYAVLGVFGIIKVVQAQEGKFWVIFLLGAIFAVLSPLTWFGPGGIALSILAGLSFLIYYLLEKK